MVADGKVRVNAERVTKTSHAVSPGQVLTFPQGRDVRVVRIEAIGTRRGPAPEAVALYTDLTPDRPPLEPRVGPRPTKRDRRALDALRDPKDPD